jgi:dTDP-4-amino-4,6-dideoxygalactose transaminase
LEDIEGLILPSHTNGEIHAWHLYVVRIMPEMWQITRNELIEKINERGIGTSVHYIPIHMHPYYAEKYGYEPGDYPIAKELSEKVVTLPLYPALTNKQVTYIVETVNELWVENRC